MNRIRILIIDSDPVSRRGLRGFLEDMGSMMVVVGEASNGSEAIECVEHRSVDGILMNVRGLGSEEVTTAVTRVVRTRPEARVLVLAAADELQAVARAIGAGARGALTYDGLTAERLVQAIRSLVSHEAIMVPSSSSLMMPRTQAAQDQAMTLSARESEVFHLLKDGKTNSAIAGTLGIKEKTVKNHVRAIYSKLGIRDRFDARQFK
ncbi:MAG: response regulator transcription factor [candidate division WOR-3 bacterium]